MPLSLFDNRAGLDQLRIQQQNAPRIGTGMLTGFINVIAGSSLLAGELFVIDDQTNKVTFVFDTGYSVTETSTRRRIELTGSETAVQMMDKIIEAINRAAAMGYLYMFAERWNVSSPQIRLKNTDYGSRVLLGESVNNSGFTVTSSPEDAYVYCLGSDLELPPLENYVIGDLVSVDQDVAITAGTKLLRIQARFRQPANLPTRETLPSSPSSSTVTRHARSGVNDIVEITTPTNFFTSDDQMRSVYISGSGVTDGIYNIMSAGYKYNSTTGLFEADAKYAILTDDYALPSPGGPTNITGYMLGSHWKASVIFDSSVVFSYDPGKDGLKERDILLPDLTINVSKFSGAKSVKYQFELVETV